MVQSVTWHVISSAALVLVFLYDFQSSLFVVTADVIDTTKLDVAINCCNIYGIIE